MTQEQVLIKGLRELEYGGMFVAMRGGSVVGSGKTVLEAKLYAIQHSGCKIRELQTYFVPPPGWDLSINALIPADFVDEELARVKNAISALVHMEMPFVVLDYSAKRCGRSTMHDIMLECQHGHLVTNDQMQSLSDTLYKYLIHGLRKKPPVCGVLLSNNGLIAASA